MKHKTSMVRAGFLLSVLSVIVALFSFLREVVIAGYLGVTSTADAYIVAVQTPEILVAIVWEALNTINIPLYTEQRYLKGDKEAALFISNILSIVCIGLLGFIIFAEIFARGIIFAVSPGLPEDAHNLAAALMRCVMPMLFFEGIIRIYTGVLNVNKRFGLPKIINTFRNIGLILFLIFFYKEIGVFAAVIGLVLGIAVECFVCFFYAQKYSRFVPYIDVKAPYIKKACRLIVPILIGSSIGEVNQFVDKIIGSFLDSGSLASLSYASKLTSIVQIVFINNVVILMFPAFSEYAAKGKRAELAKIFIRTINFLILMCMPLIFGSFVLRNEIITIVFARGAFNAAAIPVVGGIFSCYMICTLFSGLQNIAVKLLTVCGDTHTIMVNSMIGVMINVILNLILSKQFAAIGVALASVVSILITSAYLLIIAKRKLSEIKYNRTAVIFLKSILASIIMYCILSFANILQINFIGDASSTLSFLLFIFKVLLGGAAYFMILILLKTDEIKNIMAYIRRKSI
ncbi:murein biosynthesis integral membrane protein MurJ [Candidatus Merdisoma sp. JLR.KK011]|uniref:murein biosynthesis integral membrane protein MurJ n=1 Tax=Candidatus Merdisoma sp. JLR.KK011 TaxID=3114299 RepID=UPI002FF16D26